MEKRKKITITLYEQPEAHTTLLEGYGRPPSLSTPLRRTSHPGVKTLMTLHHQNPSHRSLFHTQEEHGGGVSQQKRVNMKPCKQLTVAGKLNTVGVG